jgi:hypothetical protein
MKIRKIAYQIGYVHILTFKENYKIIFAPYFGYVGIEYAIDKENTIHETIKLVFKSSGIIMQFDKESAILIYEGEVADVRKQNPVVEIFFEILEKIKAIIGFTRIAHHRIEIGLVDLLEEEKVNQFLTKNNYIVNPFDKLNELTIALEFTKEDKQYALQFGNFSDSFFNESTNYVYGIMDFYGSTPPVNQISLALSVFSSLKSLTTSSDSPPARFHGDKSYSVF